MEFKKIYEELNTLLPFSPDMKVQQQQREQSFPECLWADAISTACFPINRMPSSVLQGAIPYKTLFPQKPLFPVKPKIFGSTCFVRDVRPGLTKLDPKSLKCVFLGYSRLQKGYRCYCPSLQMYLVSIDVTFLEHLPYFTSEKPTLPPPKDDDLLVYSITSPDIPSPSQEPHLLVHLTPQTP